VNKEKTGNKGRKLGKEFSLPIVLNVINDGHGLGGQWEELEKMINYIHGSVGATNTTHVLMKEVFYDKSKEHLVSLYPVLGDVPKAKGRVVDKVTAEEYLSEVKERFGLADKLRITPAKEKFTISRDGNVGFSPAVRHKEMKASTSKSLMKNDLISNK